MNLLPCIRIFPSHHLCMVIPPSHIYSVLRLSTFADPRSCHADLLPSPFPSFDR
jgi:hypothetical protein